MLNEQHMEQRTQANHLYPILFPRTVRRRTWRPYSSPLAWLLTLSLGARVLSLIAYSTIGVRMPPWLAVTWVVTSIEDVYLAWLLRPGG